MDIVYTSLDRNRGARAADGPTEGAEIVDVLWAHAVPEDRLEHASGRAGPDRIDLLLFLRTPETPDQDPDGAQRRAAALLHRCHLASPLLRHRYLPPAPPAPPAPSAPSAPPAPSAPSASSGVWQPRPAG
ncbi:hypothetical protein [Streptacidiphilus albus]|uniref:hypothetical protein n=1 Tax=Streptacidiphilus albus TaxID=105425 RepID=UPI00054B7D38|nr:hypothetical protein [Streptacidiphilus albus]